MVERGVASYVVTERVLFGVLAKVARCLSQ